ncbi:hypothetical protein C356_01732 [Cryptococcus neoformans c45]|nr:hypothetical protein C356_01732 [Cryptococcus neoformans var. grubii c45]
MTRKFSRKGEIVRGKNELAGYCGGNQNLLNVDQKARSSPRYLPSLPRKVSWYHTASFFDNLPEPLPKERTDG